MADQDIICERRGASGFALLNRPKALNALNLDMVRALSRALTQWRDDPAVERVVVRGAGERAFCAGGDIRLIHEQGQAGDHAGQLAFWREEYRLNQMIARYPKPFVALMSGIVMGGGAGLSILGSHRVAGETLSFAMPEVSIGFCPDVGATYFLPRLAGSFGVYLGVTGARIVVGDACAAGLVDFFVPSQSFDALSDALTGSGDTDAILARFAAPPPAAKLAPHRATIAACFCAPDIATLLARLDDNDSEFANVTAADLRRKSPSSVAIAFRQMRIGGALSIEEALRVECRIVARIRHTHDLYEGIRAAIIDKDQAPRWDPSRFEALDSATIDAFFAPLGAEELTFPAASPR